MEKDINLILDVEPDEAQALVNLIELLFEEWYVAEHVREERLGKLGFVAENKDAKKAQAKPPPPVGFGAWSRDGVIAHSPVG